MKTVHLLSYHHLSLNQFEFGLSYFNLHCDKSNQFAKGIVLVIICTVVV